MIPGLFLICALAPTPMAMAHHPFTQPGVLAAHQTVAEFIMRRKRDVEKPLLVVGGDPAHVTAFRASGFRAFGVLVDDHPGVTRWHVVANADAFALRGRIFHIVYVLASNPMHETAFDLLKETVRVTLPGGFLIVSEEGYPDWPTLLRFWNWERLPLVFNGYAVWRRPFSENSMTLFYRTSMKRLGKTVLPFRQRYAMRRILEAA